ncbi:alpha/beta fold hydrolase [Aquibaculum sediminis]|uniref:alpha/beta fold hydrolase n=1 Tax=Aquibaculum sediminis TaxID=3231907 RepID=UPI003456488B
MTDFTSRFATANGIRIHYWREGSGPPLVLLHGWPEFCRTWRRLIPLLSDDFELIAPDLRGFGDSEKPYDGPSEAMTPDVLAEDLLGLLDALDISTPVGLVSHDVGSAAAQAVARRHPQRLSGLFFFNCVYPGIGARWAEPGHLKEIWYQSFHQLPLAAELVGASRENCRIYLRHFLTHWSARPEAFEDDLEAWVDTFMKPGNLQGGFNWYRSINASRLAVMRGEAPKLPPFDLPTRVLWGAQDPILKAEWMDRLPEHFSDLEASSASDAGHFVHMEQPQKAAEAIRAFFQRLSAGRA